jgi:hypothetical protein
MKDKPLVYNGGLFGECLQIIIRFFRHEVVKKRQGTRSNVVNNMKLLTTALLLLLTLELVVRTAADR